MIKYLLLTMLLLGCETPVNYKNHGIQYGDKVQGSGFYARCYGTVVKILEWTERDTCFIIRGNCRKVWHQDCHELTKIGD